jgi:hypothetical protein
MRVRVPQLGWILGAWVVACALLVVLVGLLLGA